jgi:protein-L-isoaspartate O-methyltransferase
VAELFAAAVPFIATAAVSLLIGAGIGYYAAHVEDAAANALDQHAADIHRQNVERARP